MKDTQLERLYNCLQFVPYLQHAAMLVDGTDRDQGGLRQSRACPSGARMASQSVWGLHRMAAEPVDTQGCRRLKCCIRTREALRWTTQGS